MYLTSLKNSTFIEREKNRVVLLIQKSFKFHFRNVSLQIEKQFLNKTITCWSLGNFLLIRKEENEDEKRERRRSRSAHKYRKSMNRFRARVPKRNVWGGPCREFSFHSTRAHPLFDSFPPVACNVQLPLIELFSLETPTLSISTVRRAIAHRNREPALTRCTNRP